MASSVGDATSDATGASTPRFFLRAAASATNAKDPPKSKKLEAAAKRPSAPSPGSLSASAQHDAKGRSASGKSTAPPRSSGNAASRAASARLGGRLPAWRHVAAASLATVRITTGTMCGGNRGASQARSAVASKLASFSTTAASKRASPSPSPTAATNAASIPGWPATCVSTSSGKTLKPRTLTWLPASLPQNSISSGARHRTKSPVRYNASGAWTPASVQ
mmetsp:Transcript_9249/g.28812  ORF Transcript_9249/g.28812 Transcript_9249/m.28812 type:complete len:221 (-) Transcript_9249:980-1642(-)